MPSWQVSVSLNSWMDNNSNNNYNNDGDDDDRKKKKSCWSAIENRTEFLCGKKRFPRWWSVVSLEAKITPWPKRLKLQLLPGHSCTPWTHMPFKISLLARPQETAQLFETFECSPELVQYSLAWEHIFWPGSLCLGKSFQPRTLLGGMNWQKKVPTIVSCLLLLDQQVVGKKCYSLWTKTLSFPPGQVY